MHENIRKLAMLTDRAAAMVARSRWAGGEIVGAAASVAVGRESIRSSRVVIAMPLRGLARTTDRPARRLRWG